MAQGVWRDVTPHPGLSNIGLQARPEVLSRHGATADRDEHGVGCIGPNGQILLNGPLGAVSIWNQSVLPALSRDNEPAIVPLVAAELDQAR